jgi:hypothetical protein
MDCRIKFGNDAIETFTQIWYVPAERIDKRAAMASGSLTTLRVLAAALYAGFNFVPLYGIYALGWDAFQLLLLYWGETAILLVCTLAHIACIPPDRLGTMIVNGRSVPASRLMMVGFFAVHGGGFIALHLLFLCVAFSGGRLHDIHGAAGFVHTFFIASGAWAALLLVGLAGVFDVLTGTYHPAFVDALARRTRIRLKPLPDGRPGDAVGSIVIGLYGRIIIMQVAIIFGAIAAWRFGSVAPLVILIVLKTIVDFVMRLQPASVAQIGPSASVARIE